MVGRVLGVSQHVLSAYLVFPGKDSVDSAVSRERERAEMEEQQRRRQQEVEALERARREEEERLAREREREAARTAEEERARKQRESNSLHKQPLSQQAHNHENYYENTMNAAGGSTLITR